MTKLAFMKGKTRSIVSHQIGWPNLPEHNIHPNKRKRQEYKRRRLAGYNQTIKHNSMPSDQIILYDDKNKEQIAGAQERNDESYVLTLWKSSLCKFLSGPVMLRLYRDV